MFDSERKITRKKVYPIGDYLFDKYLGLKYHTIREKIVTYNSIINITINQPKDFDDILNIDVLQNYITFIKKLQKLLNLKYEGDISLHCGNYDTFIKIYLNKKHIKKIEEMSDYNKWFEEAKIKAKKFHDNKKLKESAKKFNL